MNHPSLNSHASPLGSWPGHTGNWGRWPNDRGTLNLITPEVVLRGLRCAVLGEVFACARPTLASGSIDALDLFQQQMTHVRDVADQCVARTTSAADKLTFRVHNLDNTHIDALSHIGYNGLNFNGHANADVVSLTEGAMKMDITSALSIVTRAKLIDVARLRGVDYLEPGDCVRPEDIAEHAKRIESGDAVLIRTGAALSGGRHSEDDERGLWSGIHPDCIELLAGRGISLIGGDSTEPGPSPVPELCSRPLHVMCLTVFGIHLIHSMDLEKIARRCIELNREDMLLITGALNVPGATGSPVTPIAVL